MNSEISGVVGQVGASERRGLAACWREAWASRDPSIERRDSGGSAALKGAIVGLAAHLAFCVALLAFANSLSLDLANEPPENLASVAKLAGVGLVPSLLIGAGLGWLARHLHRMRALSLAVVALPAPVVVFAATFGLLGLSAKSLLIGALLGLLFTNFHFPIAIVSALLLAWWVRPAADGKRV